MVFPSICGRTAGSASARSRSSPLGRVGRHRQPAAQLAVHLHGHDDLVCLGDSLRRTTATTLLCDAAVVPGHLPQLFGGVRREWGDHDRPAPRSLRAAQTADCGRAASAFCTASPNAYISLTSSISAEIAVLRWMRCSTSTVTRRMVSWVFRRSFRSAGSKRTGIDAGDRRSSLHAIAPLIDKAPDAREKAPAALETGIAPFDFLLGRRDEHHIQPQRVGAELLQHLVRIDDVAFGFRHDGAFLQHHALRQQVRERLVVIDHAEIAEHAREEPRVDQVQNRVLDAADCRNRPASSTSPSPGRTAARRSSGRRTGRSTTTSRRTYPSCRSRAAPYRRISGTTTFTNSGTCASGESPRPVKFVTLGSSTGSCSYGTGTMPHASQ